MAKLWPFASLPPLSPLRHRYLRAPFLLLAIFASFSTSTLPPYNEHCGELVPQSEATRLLVHSDYSFGISSGYLTGGSALFRTANDTTAFTPPSFSFRSKSLFRTRTDGVFKLEGVLTLHGAYKNLTQHRWRFNWGPHTVVEEATFDLAGFWSESTGLLCMVGDGDFERGNGSHPVRAERERDSNQHLHVSAVLKLKYPKVSNVHTSWVNGTVESLDPAGTPNHFDLISLQAYAQTRYEFSMISQAESSCPSVKFEDESLEIDHAHACNYLYSGSFKPKLCDGNDCRRRGAGLGFSSSFMHFHVAKCSEKINLQIWFSNSSHAYNVPVIPDKSLVGEGYWDSQRSRFCIIACRILAGENLSVGDCDIGLMLWFPTVITLRNRSTIVGRMWSNKAKNEEDYFDMVSFHQMAIDRGRGFRGLNYSYTELDWVRRSCHPSSDDGAKLGDKQYPTAKSIGGLTLTYSVENGKERSGWGQVTVSSVNETFYGSDRYMDSSPSTANLEVKTNGVMSNVGSMISYTLRRRNRGIDEDEEEEDVVIAAEGVYNDATGKLCMRGCKSLEESDSLDCEILINLQLAPQYPKNERRINGTITSTRSNTDHLYFAPVNFTSNYMYRSDAAESIRWMDMEIAMALVCLTASCACIAMQIFHAKKNHHALPFVSVAMLLVLALGHAIPLLLNFEALFGSWKQVDLLLRSGRWFAASEAMVRAVSMIALFLSLRLLQLALASRSAERPSLGCWEQERRTLGWCLPLYCVGALLTYLVYRRWQALISYFGLVLDGLLLPQVVFNIGRKSKDKALTPFFYVGIMATRAAPHLNDAYQARWGGPRVRMTEFYSTAWDVVIPCVCFLLALLVHLQQRLDGASLLPGRFSKFTEYGAVPAIDEI